jgi:hypothetical protein
MNVFVASRDLAIGEPPGGFDAGGHVGTPATRRVPPLRRTSAPLPGPLTRSARSSWRQALNDLVGDARRR